MEIINETGEVSEVNETSGDNFKLIKIPVNINEEFSNTTDKPHFYLKWFPDNKRYRVSISFKYLHQTWDLKVNVVRNLDLISLSNIEFIYKLLRKRGAFVQVSDPEEQGDLSFQVIKITSEDTGNSKESHELFLFTRCFDGVENKVLVFISSEFWKLEDFLEKYKKEIL